MTTRILAALALVLLMPTSAGATSQTLTVTSTADPGDGNCATGGCTLREAMTALDDADTDDDRIVVSLTALDHTIALTSALPVIDEPLTIEGSGRFTPILDGGGGTFTLLEAGSVGDVRLARLDLRNGGGGLDVTSGEVTLERASVVDHHAFVGGGVRSTGGTLTILESTVSGNTATVGGGGVWAGGAVNVVRSTVSGNRVVDSGFDSGVGGGILSEGVLTIDSSTVSGNRVEESATGLGGGIAAVGAVIRDSTVTANAVQASSGRGGGIAYTSGSGSITLRNTIVAGNSVGYTDPDLGGSTATKPFIASHTLVGDVGGATIYDPAGTTNLIGVDPQLGTLAANGGPTLTHLPADTSPVIGAGSAELGSDQRGEGRPLGDGADIGAVEVPAVDPPPAPEPTSGAGTVPPAAPAPAPAPAPSVAAPTAGGAGPRADVRFGARAAVTLRFVSRRPTRAGIVKVQIRNGNGFTIRGRVSLRGSRARARAVVVGPRARRTVGIRLDRGTLRRLARRRTLRVSAVLRVSDPAGTTRTVKRTSRLRRR